MEQCVESAVRDVQVALDSKLCEKAARVVAAIASLPTGHRAAVRERYVGSRGQGLGAALKGLFRGEALRLVREMSKSGAERDADLVRDALDDGDWGLLTEVVCTRTNAQIRGMKEQFTMRHGEDLLAEVCVRGGDDEDFYEFLIGAWGFLGFCRRCGDDCMRVQRVC